MTAWPCPRGTLCCRGRSRRSRDVIGCLPRLLAGALKASPNGSLSLVLHPRHLTHQPHPLCITSSIASGRRNIILDLASTRAILSHQLTCHRPPLLHQLTSLSCSCKSFVNSKSSSPAPRPPSRVTLDWHPPSRRPTTTAIGIFISKPNHPSPLPRKPLQFLAWIVK